MRSFLKNFFLIVITIFFLAGQEVFAMPEILPLDKVESGMSGTGYTIVDNSGKIEPFNVDIIGLMDNGKGSQKMIMAKASGSVIEKTGGVLQGMSGSPVYVGGKLVGALSAGLKEMSPYTFFITPIESMLKIWNMPDDKAVNQYIKVKTVKEPAEEEKKSDDAEKPEEDIELDDELKFEEEKSADENSSTDAEKTSDKNSDKETSADEPKTPKTPSEIITPPNLEDIVTDEKSALFFSGFDTSGLNFLKKEMQPLGFKNFFAASAASSSTGLKQDATLEPGGAMGVAVVFGDFMVGATGTVTAVDGNRVLGFGHSFTHAGNVNFFMTDSAVVGTISGENGAGVKIASVGNIIGRINQDREAGVSGIIGTFPSVVPISVTVTDKDLNVSETYNATIAYNENLIPKLGASIAYTALSKTADSLAESTVDVDFKIKTNVVDSGIFSRQNTFYNSTDVGQVAIVELLQALNVICTNTTKESNIFAIDVTMTRDGERRTASLISAVPDKKKVKPGETVNLTVTLQPYRKATETIVVPYTIPITRPEGSMVLDIHGGSVVAVAQIAAAAPAGIITPSTTTPEQNYNEKIKKLLNSGRNNQLVVEPNAAPTVKSEREMKKEMARIKKLQDKIKKAGLKNLLAAKETKIDTNYIIDNVIQVTVDVDKL